MKLSVISRWVVEREMFEVKVIDANEEVIEVRYAERGRLGEAEDRVFREYKYKVH